LDTRLKFWFPNFRSFMVRKGENMPPQNRKPVLVVHGGAGTLHPERSQACLEGVKKAAKVGFEIGRASCRERV